eukprot:6561602-Pyramimonas_sp.AAC.1
MTEETRKVYFKEFGEALKQASVSKVRQGRGPVHLPTFVTFLGDKLTSTIVGWDFDGLGKLQEYRVAEVVRYELPVGKFTDEQVNLIS